MNSKAFPLILGLCAAACSPTPKNAYCGNAFAIVLDEGERVSSRSPVEVFVVHEVSDGSHKVVIYEGNNPEPGGIIYRTFLDWPAFVVVHSNYKFGKGVARRLVIGTPDRSKCSVSRT